MSDADALDASMNRELEQAPALPDVALGAWPPRPDPLHAAGGGRESRLQMLRHMRDFWNEQNRNRRDRIRAEVEAARIRQAEIHAYWDQHKAATKQRWANHTSGHGRTMVADIPEVAAQWHPANGARPEYVMATADRAKHRYLWQCPLGLGHAPWRAMPKDRVQKGSGCKACRQLIRLTDIPTLADQYRGPVPKAQMTYASHERVPWVYRTWAVDPVTGDWHPVEHHFEAVVKERALQGDGCRVCAGYVVDDTNSLYTWFPDIADELDDPDLDARRLPTSQHNVSRKRLAEAEAGGVYATHDWRCRHGHRWEATILNRVQGTDCSSCSTAGISKEQVRLVAELAGLMHLIQPGPPDPRLPDGLPDFASHQITVPLQYKPEHWRYQAVEVDAVFQTAAGIRIGVEYDGSFHHSIKRRDRRAHDSEKSQVFTSAGLLDLLVHVRVGGLPALEGRQALAVPMPERSTPYQQACATAAAIEARFPGSVPGLDDYLTEGRPRSQDQADAYILAVWGELRPLRRRPARTQPRHPRALRDTAPHHNSLLTPIGPPYRHSDHPAKIMRDYRCACDNTHRFTAIQAQVTSGNTKSCGCLRNQVKRQQRATAARAETLEVRQWARKHEIDVAASGRVSGRLVASYRLSRAGRLDDVATDGLLDEHRVRQWAQLHGVEMGAKGRVTNEIWLAYTAHRLSPGEPDGGVVQQRSAPAVEQVNLFDVDA
ncbi:zinc-ribbon domain-containing protein [Streptomyces sp. NPDC018059]|uniref:zinc-ribbon domain-containing protein n=1 Tax=Streptomyces sp. NPDC018059 TaxID=3365041 RepID=UPI003797B2DE